MAHKVNRGMFDKIVAGICSAALVIGMVPVSAFAVDDENVAAFAVDDENVAAFANDDKSEVATAESSLTGSQSGSEGTDGTSGSGSMEFSAEYIQNNDLANSFRYENGELIADGSSSLSDASTFAAELTFADESTFAAVENAWRLTDQGYLNEYGEVIQGALTKGIDVSEHQGVIDWDKVKADGVNFVIIRCAFYGDEGWGRTDAYWERNVSECERLGIPYGVYVYSYCHSTEAAHDAAQRTISLLQGHTPTLPVYLDLEESDYLTDISQTAIADMAAAYCGDVQSAGYKAGIYSSTSWWDNYLTDSRFNQWERWVAQWNRKCEYEGTYHVWQACSDGAVDGINGNVDVDFEMNWSYVYDTAAIDYVNRLYNVALGRDSDQAGLVYHVANLSNGKSAAMVARDFLLSSEFLSNGYSEERKIEIAYEVMLDREASSDEVSSWMKLYDENMTFDAVVYGISNSQEWRRNCVSWGVSSEPAVPEHGRDKSYAVTSYVNRLYKMVLGRDADLDGLDVQCDALINGGSAAQTADAFFDSQEFKNKGYDISTQVELVYNTMLNRASDAAGKAVWMSHLEAGMTVRSIVYNLVNSEEFQACCSEWGVIPGSSDAVDNLYASLEPRDRNIGVTEFVYRMYVYCLGRNADTVRTDTAGENWQCEAILSGMSAGQIASNFFGSEEFSNRGLSSAEKVNTAYRAFFNREPDAAGYDFWLERVRDGMEDAELAAGFAESPEFAELCVRYGVTQ